MKMRKSAARSLWPVLALLLFLVALWALHRELGAYRYHDVLVSLRRLPAGKIALALGFTALNYGVLTGYDVLALRYIGRSLDYGKVCLASFVGYAFSNSVGLSALAGSGIRFRLYSAWGLSAFEIAQVVVFYSVTFWVGLLGIGGAAFALEPMPLPGQLHLAFATTLPLGVLLLFLLGLYLGATLLWKRPLTFRSLEFSLPSWDTALLQTLLSALDWALAAAVLYALLPDTGQLSFVAFLGVFLLGQFAGVVSHIPGGLGVFEGVLLTLLSGRIEPGALFAALLAYRSLYYLLPLTLAAVLLGGYEALARREKLARVARFFGNWVPQVAPRVIALLTFVGGAVLLFSGATPALMHRVAILRDTVPLPVVEASHFLGSLTGALLLLLARGLQRRLDAAYVATALLLLGGALLSILKGLDYEEAGFLLVLLLALLPCRRYFYRKSSLLSPDLSPGWVAAVALVLVCAAWLGYFSFKHVEYSHDLWWRFAFRGEASRVLRAFVGVAALVFFLAAARLLGPAPPEPEPPTREGLERAAAIARASPHTYAHLAVLGDKSLLFSESGRSFLMYAVSGRSWIALGDPVGPRSEQAELLWRFREEVDRYGGWTVFYEVGTENLPFYLDLGLTLVKVGEEAQVRLEAFSLDGAAWKSLRHLKNKLEREGCTFEVLPPAQVEALLSELARVSDDWLEGKHTREKGFSLGFFDAGYLARFPLAVVRQEGRLIAFANLWPSDGREELSVDLMRTASDAPPGIMDYLFLRLFLWGREQGYGRFNLGMAPLSGLENRALAPLWTKIGAFLFRTGEHYYNFQGVRQYKTKFGPQWAPRYIAFPGGISLAPVLANIAALVGRGLKGVVSR
jgi:phosphatidylglycerol lysyltransferase